MTIKPFRHLLTVMAFACLLTPLSSLAASTDNLWHDVAGRSLVANAPKPDQFRSLSLDSRQMVAYLAQSHARGIATEVSLPLPEGGFSDFNVVDSGTLPPELQAKYPEILSFKGADAEGRRLRLDVSPLGFQAMVFDKDGIWMVRPEVIAGGNDNYLSYRRGELAGLGGQWQCETHGDQVNPLTAAVHPKTVTPSTVTGAQQRVYRAAVAANHQYIAAVGGGTVAGGLAAVTTAVNRVTEVYEYEMSIRLVLVPSNDQIMYPTSNPDPFSSNGTGVINNSTSVINAAIGSGNYDIGHVFTTGSGGVAGLGVVCGGSKARGTTGLSNPIGDDFYIDYVAHEMGHQFAGNHPFNGSNGNCSGSNRNGSTAYEPGSGSSIMAYAGICGADDLQPHSDPYFHAISLQEITNFTNGGGNCSVNTPASNQPPVIAPSSLPPSGKTIPVQTPFMLYASATDPSNDGLAYSWEEWDLGPQAPLSAGDNGSSPIFRSYSPVASGVRSFPSMSTVLGGPAIKGETVPTKSRTALKFRLTVRDRSDAAHGWGTSQSTDYQVAVTNTAGPFKVNTPGSGASWTAGSTVSITWDVANTNLTPVSCASVDIDLSLDAGASFTQSLAVGVSNSGSASVIVPAANTTQARVRVMCSDNIFFNVSPGNFNIEATTYTIGGTVSGLNGSGLVLLLNGGNALPIAANGPFTFAAGLLAGAPYDVSVGTAPNNPYQECVIDNGHGTVNASHVTDVGVTCTNATPPFIFGDGFEEDID